MGDVMTQNLYPQERDIWLHLCHSPDQFNIHSHVYYSSIIHRASKVFLCFVLFICFCHFWRYVWASYFVLMYVYLVVNVKIIRGQFQTNQNPSVGSTKIEFHFPKEIQKYKIIESFKCLKLIFTSRLCLPAVFQR